MDSKERRNVRPDGEAGSDQRAGEHGVDLQRLQHGDDRRYAGYRQTREV